MSNCVQCGAPVEPPLTVCASCAPSTATQESAPSPEPLQEIPAAPPRLRGDIIRERAIAGAKTGAIWGAGYGIAYAFMTWSIVLIFSNISEDEKMTLFLPALLKCAVVGSVVTAAAGAFLRQFPQKKPPKK